MESSHLASAGRNCCCLPETGEEKGKVSVNTGRNSKSLLPLPGMIRVRLGLGLGLGFSLGSPIQYFADKGRYSKSYGFSSHIWMWEAGTEG